MAAATPAPAPATGNADLPARESLHQIAATLAAGVAGSFQLAVSSLDPTFKDDAIAKLVALQWGAHKVYYAALLAALADPAWGSPQQAVAPVAPPASGAGLPDLLKTLTTPSP